MAEHDHTAQQSDNIETVSIEDELKQSYISYAMSVIIGRALPDVRDGLKPVHRRVLYAMYELKNDWNKPYKKSARIIGNTIGKYHPHGDSAVYDTLVRMAQNFSLRYPLVDGQGNFGSVDGDAPAAMRYTEARMSKITHDLLRDIDKETVDFVPNYDDSETEPSVLPTRVPQLLINGAAGIAVGMATNIPPHNLGEVIDAAVLLLKTPDSTITDILKVLPGPDFPTAALINGKDGIHEAYTTGRGRIYVRARTHIEGEEGEKQSIIVDELPFQVNKARLLERIAELVKDKKITGISALRDESDRQGMRMVIELKRSEIALVVLNQLYKLTDLQNVFGMNLIALVDGKPQLLTVKDILHRFLDHRRDVVTRRSIFDLKRASAKSHVLAGLAVALANIDAIVDCIKQSPSPKIAKERLQETAWEAGSALPLLRRSATAAETTETQSQDGTSYRLSEAQAQAILDLRLHRLTGLEQDKIISDWEALLAEMTQLRAILDSRTELDHVIHSELIAIKEQFADTRRTEIIDTQIGIGIEDLIAEEKRVVLLSHTGYVKTQTLTDYSAQHRGGRGKSAANVKENDFVAHVFIANSHDTVLCFSDAGRVYWLKVYELPFASRIARGKPIVNLLPLEKDENIRGILPIDDFNRPAFVFMATKHGIVKKTALSAFARPRKGGIIACDFSEGDDLIAVALTDGKNDVMLFTQHGQSIRFYEQDVRPTGRNTRGVRGVRLAHGDTVVAMLVIDAPCSVLTVTENGYGKRTPMKDYSCQKRGGSGVRSIKTTARNGSVIGAIACEDADEIMLITGNSKLIRMHTNDISLIGRNTQGVRLITLESPETVANIARITSADIDTTQ